MGMIKLPPAAIEKFENHYPEIFASGNLSEGKWNEALSAFFKRYTGAAAASVFSSNGSGLLAILLLLKRYRDFKRIFIQANTMYGVKTIAISSGLDFLGAVPSSLRTLMPTADQVRAFLDGLKDPRDTVFLITHIGGIVNPEITEIAELCKARGVALVEDCAHSLGATFRGRHTGLFGVAGVYSLYATKSVPAGEGGVAVTNDEDLGRRLSKFLIYDRFDRQMDVGVNFRVSELQALLSLCVCEQSEHIIASKAAIAGRYIKACLAAGVEFVDPCRAGQRGNHYKFTLLAKDDAAKEFVAITNRTSPVYDYALGPDPERIASRHICLPIWYGLEEEVVSATISQLDALARLSRCA